MPCSLLSKQYAASALCLALPSLLSQPRIRVQVCKEHGASNKMLFHALRYLLTGGKEGPGVVDTMATLGRERALQRLRKGTSVNSQ